MGGETRARGRTDGIRKVTMYSDLLQLDLGSSDWVLHGTRGERLELAHGRAVSVRTPGGGRVCARRGVVLAGGVFGTAEVLMRTLGRTELGGLWEQTVLPPAPVLLEPSLVSMADCADDLRTGNLHLAGRTRPQAEFTICAANAAEGRPSPVLLAAWVISMNATERGNVTLQDPATDRVSGSLAPAAPAVMEEAARAIFAELRARYGSDLMLPVVSAAFTLGSHHLGGGLRGAATAGRVHGLGNVFVGDMSAYSDDVWGYTTAAAAVAGITAAMRTLEDAERHGAAPGPPPPRSTSALVAVATLAMCVTVAIALVCNAPLQWAMRSQAKAARSCSDSCAHT